MHAPGVFAAAGDGEADAIAAEAPRDAGFAPARSHERAAQPLHVLRELELAGRQAPQARDLRRHEVEERRAPARAGVAEVRARLLVPALDAVGIDDDARAGRELQELGREASQVGRQEEKREHGRLREVRLEHVALHELGALGDSRRRGIAPRKRHHFGLVLDAERASAALGRGDHHAPVARAEVDDEVALGEGGEIEHPLDERVARRYPDDVLSRLAFVGLEALRDGGRDKEPEEKR